MNFFVLGAGFTLAAFAAVSLCASAGAALVWPLVRSRWARLPAAARARRLLAFRLIPTACSALAAFGLVLPAYLVLERRDTTESLGAILGPLAVAGLALAACALARTLSAARRTARVVAEWEKQADRIGLAGVEGEAYRVETLLPVVALAGFSKARLFIAGRVLDVCRPELVSAMAAHEMSHRRACDNLKRLLLEGCTDPLAGASAGREALRAWEAASEEAADDDAIAAGARPADLAEALLRVARLAPAQGFPEAAAAAAFYRGEVLERRVRRLISDESRRTARARGSRARRAVAAAALLALWTLTAWALARPVHGSIEKVVGAPASIYEVW